MKNTLLDVHNLLMEQLERLSDDELKEEDLDIEIKRSKSITELSKVIVDNSKTMLDATKLKIEYGASKGAMPKVLIGNEPNGDE